VDSYKVTYRFNILGQAFQNTDIIPLTIVNQKLLTEIVERGTNNVCVVKYDTDDPNRSIIVEKE
jgi:hypothetical protein